MAWDSSNANSGDTDLEKVPCPHSPDVATRVSGRAKLDESLLCAARGTLLLLWRSHSARSTRAIAVQLFLEDPEAGPDAQAAAAPAGWEAPLAPDPAAPAPGGAAIPVRQQRAAEAAARRGGADGGDGAAGMRYEASTVLESDVASLARECRGIARNLKLVCNPLIRQEEVTAMLQHWDMWGPLARPRTALALLPLHERA